MSRRTKGCSAALLSHVTRVSRFPGGSTLRDGPFSSEAPEGRPGRVPRTFRLFATYCLETNVELEPFSVSSSERFSIDPPGPRGVPHFLLIDWADTIFVYDALREVLMWSSEHVLLPWRLSHWLPASRGVELIDVVRGKRPSIGPICSPAEFAKSNPLFP